MHQEKSIMKKSISILLVFSVNLFILAHAILPHHHHSGVPHFTLFETIHAEDQQHHDSCCCNENEKQADSDCCVMDQDVDLFHEDEENCFCGLTAEHSHEGTIALLQAILFFSNIEQLWFFEKIPLEKPYLITYHYDPVYAGFGLRAPPSLMY